MQWVKVSVDFCDDPKLAALGLECSWLFLASILYAGRHETDGYVPNTVTRRLTELPESWEQGERLIAAGLWTRKKDGIQITNYLRYQSSRDTMQRERLKASKRQQRRRAGIKDTVEWDTD